MSNPNTNPSLLEDEARGGDTGEGGISFQAEVGLSYIPKWLAKEGFTSMVREGMGDTEAKFFIPGCGFIKEFIEVKNHQVTPTEFWEEVDRFRRMDIGAPGEYPWFTLASAGLSQSLHPLVNSLRRIRDPYDFYANSAIFDASYNGYVEVVKKLEKTEEQAKFLFTKVLIVSDLSLNQHHGRAMFKQSLCDNLKGYQDLPDRVLNDIYNNLASLVKERRNKTITRIALEESIRQSVPKDLQPPIQPVRIHTAINNQEVDVDKTELQFAWAPFFGGNERKYPATEEWNQKLLGDLYSTKEWILNHRKTKRIKLTGNRRLSASLAFGFVFSAVSGFAIDMINRGDAVWSTDAHADGNTPPYLLTKADIGNNKMGNRLIVSIGIIRDIANKVDSSLAELGLAGMPTLHIRGGEPIVSPQQANLIVKDLKNEISEAIQQTGAVKIDLFIAAPAFLALLLGHRLNAIASSVQCYELAEGDHYVQTCLLL